MNSNSSSEKSKIVVFYGNIVRAIADFVSQIVFFLQLVIPSINEMKVTVYQTSDNHFIALLGDYQVTSTSDLSQCYKYTSHSEAQGNTFAQDHQTGLKVVLVGMMVANFLFQVLEHYSERRNRVKQNNIFVIFCIVFFLPIRYYINLMTFVINLRSNSQYNYCVIDFGGQASLIVIFSFAIALFSAFIGALYFVFSLIQGLLTCNWIYFKSENRQAILWFCTTLCTIGVSLFYIQWSKFLKYEEALMQVYSTFSYGVSWVTSIYYYTTRNKYPVLNTNES